MLVPYRQAALRKRPSSAFAPSSDFLRRSSLTHPVTTEAASRFVFSLSFRALVGPFFHTTALGSLRSAYLIILIRFSLNITAPSSFISLSGARTFEPAAGILLHTSVLEYSFQNASKTFTQLPRG